MDPAGWVARHAKLVVAVWILAAVVAAPLFAKLHSVVKVQQYSLPESSEAKAAERLLERVRGGGASPGIVIVQGVDLRDNDTLLRLIRWARAYNETLVGEGVAYRADGFPMILAAVNESLYRRLLENITAAANQSLQLYRLVDSLDKAYSEALENLTATLRRLNETAYMVAEADRAYAEAAERLMEAAEAARRLAEGLAKLDLVYANTTESILSLAEKLNQTARLLAAMDAAYARLAAENPGADKTTLALEAARLVAQDLPEEIRDEAERLAAALPLLDPQANGTLASSPEAALRAAEELLLRAGVPRDAVRAATQVLGSADPRRAAAGTALETLRAGLEGEQRELLQLLARYDPLGVGRLAADKVLLAKAVAELLAARGGDREIMEKLTEMVIVEDLEPGEAARRLALEAVAAKAAEKAGAEAAERLRGLLERLDPEAKGAAADPARVVEALLSSSAAPFTAQEALDMLRNETLLRLRAAELVLGHAAGRLPPEAGPLAGEVLRVLAEKGPGLSENEKWGLVERLVMERLGAAPPEAREVALLALGVARGRAAAEEAAAEAATRILLSRVAPRLLNETRGLMVSRGLDGFTVMIQPVGDSQAERARNTRRAGDFASETLAAMGFKPRIYVTGYDLLMEEVREYARHDVERTSRLSEAATFVVLLLILESVFAVLLPYIGIVMGLLAGGALVYLAAKAGVISLDTTAQSMMITTALGLGADYAAYIVYRFREEVARGRKAREAAAEALRRAGPAVVASALTVIIGFGSLLLGWEIGFLRGMGEAIPVTVAATAAAGLTLVPALLALVGGSRGFWWPRRPSRERHVEKESRAMRLLHHHHRVVLAALVAVMLIGGYYYATFQGSHDMKLLLPGGAEALQAFRVLQRDYLPGLTDPVYVVVELPEPLPSNTSIEALRTIVEAVEAVDGVGAVISPLSSGPGAGRLASSDGRIALIEAILSVDPYSDQGIKAVRELHSRAHSAAREAGVEVYVGGAPYAVLEMDDTLRRVYYGRILPAAAALMIAVFTAIFGSLPASIAAFMVIIGSAVMGIALSVAVFQGLLGEQVPWFLNIVAMIAVLGVGMDYNSFFLARALEECRRNSCRDTEEALAKATGMVGLFIIGLALVVSSAYLSMLAASNTGMRAMGFTLGATILLAGLMAGYLFTPLVIALLGERAWWPWGMKRGARGH